MQVDGPILARMLAAARARNPRACALLDAYVTATLDRLDAERTTLGPDDFRARLEALRARHPSAMPAPVTQAPPPAPYQDQGGDE